MKLGKCWQYMLTCRADATLWSAGFHAEGEDELSVEPGEEATVHAELGGLMQTLWYAGFQAEGEDELSVELGEEVTVHAEVEGWVQATRARDGVRGLVPASYVAGALA